MQARLGISGAFGDDCRAKDGTGVNSNEAFSLQAGAAVRFNSEPIGPYRGCCRGLGPLRA